MAVRKPRFGISVLLVLLLIVSLVIPAGAFAQVQAAEKDVELWKALLPLDTVVSFMNTGAHPDDEQSALLAYLSLGKGVRSISLIANRGEGGQNEIGKELFNALGMIRTRELEEAAKLLNLHLILLSEKPDDPIFDFGFSKSPEETLQKWGEEITYERLIRRIRETRPDIVMPSFLDDPSQHGHHRAISQLTQKAFEDAANPKVFPEHLKRGLQPWQVKKLYLPGTASTTTLKFNIGGKVDPVYGLTYPQLGEESRKYHKSQGMGRDLPVADYYVNLQLAKSAVGKIGAEQTIFDNLPYDFREYGEKVKDKKTKVKLSQLQAQYDAAIKSYPNHVKVTQEVQKALKSTRELIKDLKKHPLAGEQQSDLLYRLQVKEKQLEHASAVASRVKASLDVSDGVWTPGSAKNVTIQIQNDSTTNLADIQVKPVLANKDWKAKIKAFKHHLGNGDKLTISAEVKAPANSNTFYEPYQPSAVQFDVSYKLYGETVTQRVSVDPLKQTVALLPDWGLLLTPESGIVNTEKKPDTKKVTVQVTNYLQGPSKGTLELQLPEGWKAEPSSQSVEFQKFLESKNVTFTITTSAEISEKNYAVPVVAKVNGKTFSKQVQTISYPHIGKVYYVRDAKAGFTGVSLKFNPNRKIGYVESGFDNVSNALKEAGLNVHSLTEADLKSGDLSQYDTIVVGIRAYLSRKDLLENNQRLLDYVKNGGHVVMQYHKPSDNWKQELAPYPLIPGDPPINWRVTDENAPVTFLDPNHSIIKGPNLITSKDFDNWVQERAVYFPSTWDEQNYKPLFSMADPGEKPFTSGVLVANYGKGTYIYTSLVLYRQIQSQVPGGYRLMVNLIEHPYQSS
ncbi:PIG-L family deacetylase [Thermoflavimicrobium dichotomicum]|uniref:N-acetylglucosaminyl deacetylase, LmbE family n=1 Tax=Thermoflavimicrobium dichotomicum TaxID=46223 RepID=A0A1I3Q4M3_9BACL|nr:PIG-L family deacetylase [Thermoflavimicrobium dichotomicum]SFJ28818.1 N-acetylglucosaminyl deacetylase, LmbE family [Thermoflavimicrobium dichotomicum]